MFEGPREIADSEEVFPLKKEEEGKFVGIVLIDVPGEYLIKPRRIFLNRKKTLFFHL